MCRSKEASKLRVTGLCEGNSPVTGELPAQRASNAENVSIRWRHHVTPKCISIWYIWNVLYMQYAKCADNTEKWMIIAFNLYIWYMNPHQCIGVMYWVSNYRNYRFIYHVSQRLFDRPLLGAGIALHTDLFLVGLRCLISPVTGLFSPSHNWCRTAKRFVSLPGSLRWKQNR